MLGTTDWLLKRFLKFVLKRNVGKYLTSEIDLEQLDVKLDTGKLELKNLLLNCDVLNKDLALDGWHVKAGYVGSVSAKLPLASLSSAQCSVIVDEVMLTVAPTPAACGDATASASAHPDAASAAPPSIFPLDIPASNSHAAPVASPSSSGGGMGFLLADDFGWTGHGAVMDGIRRIAGSLQAMLQHMRVEASNVLVRIELPHPTERGRVVTAALKLDLVEFGDLSAAAASASATPAPGHHHHHEHHGQHHGHRHANKASNATPRPHAGSAPGHNGGGPSGAAAAGTAGTNSSAAAAGSSAASGGRREIAKYVQIKGLSLDLFESTPLQTGAATANGAANAVHAAVSVPRSSAPASANAGTAQAAAAQQAAGVTLVSGPGKHGVQLSVEVRMVLHDDQNQPTQIAADVHLGAVRLQLLPSHAVCLSALSAALSRSSSSPAAAAGFPEGAAGGVGESAAAEDPGSPDLWASMHGGGSGGRHAGQWGQRSLFESIMMPNCEDVVAHSLQPYMSGAGGAGSVYGNASEEFQDARSRFGSLANSFVSGVAQTGTSLLGYVAASGGAAVSEAMGWMAGAPEAQHAGARGGLEQAERHAASGPGAAAAAAGMPATPAFSMSGPAAAAVEPPAGPKPVISVHAHVSHTAVVLCYAAAQEQAGQPMQNRKGAATALGAKGGTAGNNVHASNPPAGSHVGGGEGSCGGGSLVLELHDVGCDFWLDEAHGNGLALQAGQLQVYEQLPAGTGSKYGMTPLEWSRVPEALPQAPYRFRPTQPSPARSSSTGAAGAAAAAAAGGISPRLGIRTTGRNNQSGAGSGSSSNSGCGAGGSGSLQTWPVLSCASTLPLSSAGQSFSHATHGSFGTAHHGNFGNSRHVGAPSSAALHGSSSSSGSGVGGSGCLKLCALWGVATVADGGGGSYAVPPVPSLDVSLEVLPVTVWLSLPLLERLTDFAAPLGLVVEPPKPTAGAGKPARVAPKPTSPMSRLSVAVAAPHVCVLFALLSASPQTSRVFKPPGSPAFVAVDIVSPRTHLEGPAQPFTHYPHHPHTNPGQPTSAATGPQAPVYGSYAAPATYGSTAPYGAHQVPYNGGYPSNHQHGQYNHAAPSHGSLHPTPAAWAAAWPGAAALPPLLSIHRAPATDRLIPSQVTTVDLVAGVVELLLVRTAAADAASPAQDPSQPDSHWSAAALGPCGHVGQQQPQQQQSAAQWRNSNATESTVASPWTSKSLFSLNPSFPSPPPPSSAGVRTSWDAATHAAPPIGPNDVPPGAGLHLHVCSDPGVGFAPELVSEAWGHVTAHSQDRWADPDGEGGAWEERSSFRSVAFHERCRRSSATFVHLRAPQALLRLTRNDMADVAALPGLVAPSTPPPAAAASCPSSDSPRPPGAPNATSSSCCTKGSVSWASPRPAVPADHRSSSSSSAAGSSSVPQQMCALLEIGLTIQLQDDPAVSAPLGNASAVASAPPASAAAAPGLTAPQRPTAASAAAAAAAAPTPCGSATGNGSSSGPSRHGQGLGLGLGGSRVAMYELVVEELTLFRACGLGMQPGCNVTSLHVHGVTMMGHLEPPQQPQQQQPQPPPASVVMQQQQPASGRQRHGLSAQPQGPSMRGPPSQQQPQPQTSASAVRGPGPAICLLHCPRSSGAADKAPAYIEYVCMEGRQPQPLQSASRMQTGAAGWSRRTSMSSDGNYRNSLNGGGGGAAAASPAEAAAAAAAPEVVHSVLLQGVTVSTDHGYVSMDWAVQLGALFEAMTPPPSAGSAQPTAAESEPPPQGSHSDGGISSGKARLLVNIVDMALRHEPMDYPVTAAAAAAGAAAE